MGSKVVFFTLLKILKFWETLLQKICDTAEYQVRQRFGRQGNVKNGNVVEGKVNSNREKDCCSMLYNEALGATLMRCLM